MWILVLKLVMHPSLQLHLFVVGLMMEMVSVQFALDLQCLPGVLVQRCLLELLTLAVAVQVYGNKSEISAINATISL